MLATFIKLRNALPILALLAANLEMTTPARASDPEDVARVRRAVAYLNDRQAAWSQFPKAQRGQGSDKTACVSCHTGLSYALARPALAAFVATPKTTPTPVDDSTRSTVLLRVEHWSELDIPRFRLMYDMDEDKKHESRGTEAVLNAVILSRFDASHGDKSPSAPTRRALDYLWQTQTTDPDRAGSWPWLNFGYEPWEADDGRVFGASLAAIAVGTAPGYLTEKLDDQASRGVRLLRTYLKAQFSEATLHDRLWILEASSSLGDILSPEQKRDLNERITPLQRPDGGWALPTLGHFGRHDGTPQPTDSDGYATGLVLHALLRTGPDPTRPEVAKAIAWIRSHQQPDGSWPGHSLNKKRDPASFVGRLMSDAATATAALALTEAAPR